jgi:hypothetical protein
VLDKRAVDTDLKAMSQAERRTLKSLGVRIGAFSLFLPSVLRGEATATARALTPGGWRGESERLALAPSPRPTPAPWPPTACAWWASTSSRSRCWSGWTPCCARASGPAAWC